MEENKKRSIRITGTGLLGIVLITMAAIALIAMLVLQVKNNKKVDNITDLLTSVTSKSSKVDLEGENIVKFAKDAKYRSDFFVQNITFPKGMPAEGVEAFNRKGVLMNYAEYEAYCKQFSLTQQYKDSNKKYVVYSVVAMGAEQLDVQIPYSVEKDETITVYLYENSEGDAESNPATFIVIPVSENINNVLITSLQEQDGYLFTYEEPSK